MKRTHFFSFLFLLIISSITFAQSPEATKDKCHVNRAVFDIGSGSTKLFFATVNTCDKTIAQVHLQTFIPVPYQAALDASEKNGFNANVIGQGQRAIEDLLKKCREKAPVHEAYGVATAAFRQGKNAHAVLKQFKKELGVDIAIINQNAEAILGLVAVEHDSAHKNQNLPVIVWDIGGGSQQIITRGPQGELITLGGAVATETFKKMLIEELHEKDSTQVTTANPIGIAKINDAFEIAHNMLAFPARHATRLFNHVDKTNHQVIGIGAVHDSAIKVIRNNTNTYTKDELMDAIKKYAGHNDEQMMEVAHDTHAKFAGNLVSNLILLHAMMDAFQIEKVTVAPINASDALLIDGLNSQYIVDCIVPEPAPKP